MALLLFLYLVSPVLDDSILEITPFECLLIQNREKLHPLSVLLPYAIQRGYRKIRLQGGVWEVREPVILTRIPSGLTLTPEPGSQPVIIQSAGRTALVITQTSQLVIEDMVFQGNIEMEDTENIILRRLIFRGAGVHFRGRRCNQPLECSSFNRNHLIEDCVFENSRIGIQGERLQYSTIRRNRFVGTRVNHCEEATGILLDGTWEDIDRRLEYGHNKNNLIEENSFERELATGIRVRYSMANWLRDNRFQQSFRAIEMLEGARYNQITGNYIAYLSQGAVSSSCPVPCGLYVGPGSINNIFMNNFFEQNFELQFVERHKNRLAIVDESGGRNVFRSDYVSIPPSSDR